MGNKDKFSLTPDVKKKLHDKYNILVLKIHSREEVQVVENDIIIYYSYDQLESILKDDL